MQAVHVSQSALDPLPGLKSEDSYSVAEASSPGPFGPWALELCADCFRVRTALSPSSRRGDTEGVPLAAFSDRDAARASSG